MGKSGSPVFRGVQHPFLCLRGPLIEPSISASPSVRKKIPPLQPYKSSQDHCQPIKREKGKKGKRRKREKEKRRKGEKEKKRKGEKEKKKKKRKREKEKRRKRKKEKKRKRK